MKTSFLLLVFLLFGTSSTLAEEEYLGCFGFGCTSYESDSLANPFGAGSSFQPNSPANPFGPYGSPYSPNGARNPYTTGGAEIYNEDGKFRGTLNSNRYDPDSVANPFGRYGSPFSPESHNNPFTTERYDVFAPQD